MKFKNNNEVEEPELQDIMTANIEYFECNSLEEAKNYCKERDITYLPSKKKKLKVHKFNKEPGDFTEIDIQESQKISPYKKIFDKDCVELFKENPVLFIYEQDELKGIVHFSDYNREPVYIYLYSQILNFEKSLRKLLIRNNLRNEDMRKYFEEKCQNGSTRDKKNYIDKLKNLNKNSLKSFSEFQLFYLSDLIDLLHHHKLKGKDGKKIKINKNINDNLRNCVMHSRNTIKLKDYEESVLIYNFDSFEEMFNLVLTLYEEKEKVDELNA
jgi:hypothetical protein